MTKTEKEVTKGYIINGFKHFTQLATEYFPNHASCSSVDIPTKLTLSFQSKLTPLKKFP